MTRRIAAAFTLCVLLAACSGAAPATSSPPATAGPTRVAPSPALPTTLASPDGPAGLPSPTAASTPAASAPAPATAAAGATTFTLVLADGPREGTWEVSAPGGGVPTCQYLPDLERWIATWLGPPPLSFVDVRGDDDPFLLFTFSDEPDELGFLPTGDITFDADDRGETATLHWVSESHDADYIDDTGNHYGTVETGQAELTIECGSIFRYT